MLYASTSAHVNLFGALKETYSKMLNAHASQWITCTSQAIDATLSLEGKPNPLPSVDSLLDTHPLAFQWVVAALKGDIVVVPTSSTSLCDTDAAGTLQEQLWHLVHEYQEQYCNKAALE